MLKFFKKKEPGVVDIKNILPFDPPEILVEAKIKPTTCRICGTVYQAKKEHLHCALFEISHCRTQADCPTCGCENNVTFDKTTEDPK